MNQDQVALHRSYPIATVAVTSLGFLLVQLDGSIVNVALSQIGAALRTGISDLQWTVDVYFIAFAVLLLSAGH
jgi:MFS transporter, DHA2 family, methylenomycin A resistance protein